MVSEPSDYYDIAYGVDYEARQPRRKLEFYLALVSRHCPGGALYDVGCAFGSFAEVAATRYSVHGSDVSARAVQAARERCPGGAFEIADANDLTLPPGAYDAITMLDVLEHLRDPADVLARVREGLRERGVALIVVPVYDGPLGWIVDRLDSDTTHLHRRGRRYWLDLVRSAGLVGREWLGVFRYLPAWGHYIHRPTRALRSIAPAIAMVAQKGTHT